MYTHVQVGAAGYSYLVRLVYTSTLPRWNIPLGPCWQSLFFHCTRYLVRAACKNNGQHVESCLNTPAIQLIYLSGVKNALSVLEKSLVIMRHRTRQETCPFFVQCLPFLPPPPTRLSLPQSHPHVVTTMSVYLTRWLHRGFVEASTGFCNSIMCVGCVEFNYVADILRSHPST